jgi:hypothetical protein
MLIVLLVGLMELDAGEKFPKVAPTLRKPYNFSPPGEKKQATGSGRIPTLFT